MDKIIEYFKDNRILGIILLAVVVILLILIVTAIVVSCKKKSKKKEALQESVPDTNEITSSDAETMNQEPETISAKNDTNTEDTASEAAKPAKSAPTENAERGGAPVAAKTTGKEKPAAVTKDKEENAKSEDLKPAAKPAPAAKEELSKAYAGKWVVSESVQNADGTSAYCFELRASNGEKLLSSVDYKSVQGAKNGIKTYKTNIEKDNFVLSQNKKGDYFFKLLNGSGNLLSTGEQYQSKSSCESAIESVKRFAKTAVIVVEEKEEK